MRLVSLLLIAACHNSFRTQTKAFVPQTPCGQGPYDIHLVVDGKTPEEGVEVVACTPRRLVGNVEIMAGDSEIITEPFGDVADNQRCLAGNQTIVATRSDSAASTTSAAAGAGTAAAAPALMEMPYSNGESAFIDEICRPYHMDAQRLGGVVTGTDWLRTGSDLHVRIWSDAPNDLQGVIFLVRHQLSNQSFADYKKEQAKRDAEYAKEDHSHDKPYVPPPTPVHGAPPAPLVEERPPRSTANATWIAGYWTWTGTAWGWIAGFWRDERVAMPAPQMEMPGAPPSQAAVWIGGAWQLQAGAWIWIHGRWR